MVGKAPAKTFLLHSELLTTTSKRFAISLQGEFREAAERRIELPDEDPDVFGYFLKYLYGDEWLRSSQIEHEAEYPILARLYALGERLQAIAFQRTVLLKFMSSFNDKTQLSDQGLCDVLEIACAEITARVDEDPFRDQVFWYATRRLTQLQKYGRFKQLLSEQPDLGASLCMRASSSGAAQPAKPNDPVPARFRSESVF